MTTTPITARHRRPLPVPGWRGPAVCAALGIAATAAAVTLLATGPDPAGPPVLGPAVPASVEVETPPPLPSVPMVRICTAVGGARALACADQSAGAVTGAVGGDLPAGGEPRG